MINFWKKKKKTEAAPSENGLPTMVDLISCSCGTSVLSIFKRGTYHAGPVIQISCGCGIGVHGRTTEQAIELWTRVQQDLYRRRMVEKRVYATPLAI